MKVKPGALFCFRRNADDIPHPFVVIEERLESKLLICGIKTDMRKVGWPGNIVIPAGTANLEKKGIVDVSQLLTVKNTALGEYIGRLSDEDLSLKLSGIRLIEGIKKT